MPGGRGNINGNDGKLFSSEHQPDNYRKPTKFLTELLIKELNSEEEIIIEGIDTITGKSTKVRVPMPTQRQVVQALLRQAKKGNVNAVREVYDRVEGKAPQPLEHSGPGGSPLQLIFQQDSNSEPLLDE